MVTLDKYCVMITINKKVRISKTNQKIEFELENLPEGEYDVQLLVGKNGEMTPGKDYNLENWSSGIKLDPLPTFRREDMYGEDGR